MYDDYKWEISVAQLDFGIESSHLHLPFERERESNAECGIISRKPGIVHFMAMHINRAARL